MLEMRETKEMDGRGEGSKKEIISEGGGRKGEVD